MLVIEEGHLRLEENLLKKIRSQKKVIPDLDSYLANKALSSDSAAFLAARKGDIIILEMLLGSEVVRLLQHFFKLSKSLTGFKEARTQLFRQLYFLKIQNEFLIRYYKKHGNDLSVDKLESHLQKKVNGVLRALIMGHRSSLKKAKVVLYQGEFVVLNHSTRVQHHKEFIQTIQTEAKENQFETNTESIFQLWENYRLLEARIRRVKFCIKLLAKEEKGVQDEAEQVLQKITAAFATRSQGNYKLLNHLHSTGDFTPSSQLKTIKNILMLPEVSIDISEPKTGNTLLHEALSQGEYLTADYLILKGHNITAENITKVRAIDTQDREGNFYLLYLAHNKSYDLICDYISQNARIDLINNNGEGLLDITRDGNSLLYFLLDKITTTSGTEYRKYRAALLRLTALTVSFQHLLMQTPQNITIFAVILKLPDIERTTILNTMRWFRLSERFFSKFETDLNFAMWQHFFDLFDQHSNSSSLTAPLLTLMSYFTPFADRTQQKLTQQLKLLEGICIQLKISKNENSDRKLFAFMKSILDEVKGKPGTKELFATALKLYTEDLAHREAVRDNYATLQKEDIRDCYLDNSYKFIRNRFPTQSIGQAPQPIEQTPINGSSFTPVFKPREAKPSATQSTSPPTQLRNHTFNPT